MTHSNKLCLVLLATSKEYRSGEVHKCLDSYFSSEASQGHSIDVKIFFNNGDLSNYSDLLKYEKNKNINKIIIKSLKIEGMDEGVVGIEWVRKTLEGKVRRNKQTRDIATHERITEIILTRNTYPPHTP